MNDTRSPIQSFYKDKTIFITGATGFMGKILLEKLLYSCSDLDKIYFLIRPKNGRSIKLRLDDIFKLPVRYLANYVSPYLSFGVLDVPYRIRQEKGHVLKKVQPLNGDITMHNLGLIDEQWEALMKEVHIVFHFAANLQMKAELKDYYEILLWIDTKRVLDLAKQMKHLQVFLHLSTAFCYADRNELDEDIYDAFHDPNDIMRLVQWMDESTLDLIAPN